MAPATACAKLLPTLPRGVVGPVALPVTRIDKPGVLVQAGMGDSPFAYPDARHAVAEHEASGRQVAKARLARRCRAGRGPGSAPAGSGPAGCRRRSDGLDPPHRPSCCASRSPAPRASARPKPSKDSHLARCSVAASNTQSVSRFTSAPTIWPSSSSRLLGTVDRLAEATAQMVDAVKKARGGLIARARIAAGEKIGVIAVRGRVGHLGEIWSSDSAEPLPVARELVHRPRLEAVAVRAGAGRAGHRGAGYPFMLPILSAALDRPERSGRARNQHDGARENQ